MRRSPASRGELSPDVSAAIDGELDDLPHTLWEELWGGSWSVASVHERAAARVLVLRRGAALLTRAERKVVVLAARSATLKQIAATLGIRESTASTHLSRSLHKLGFQHRAEFVALLGVASGRGLRSAESNK